MSKSEESKKTEEIRMQIQRIQELSKAQKISNSDLCSIIRAVGFIQEDAVQLLLSSSPNKSRDFVVNHIESLRKKLEKQVLRSIINVDELREISEFSPSLKNKAKAILKILEDEEAQ